MRSKAKKVNLFYLLPRILAVSFIFFLSVFALDVLGQSGWLVGLLVHLIPSYIFIALTALAWKYEMVGGLAFILFSVPSIFFFHSTIVFVPAFIIGGLFLLSYKANK